MYRELHATVDFLKRKEDRIKYGEGDKKEDLPPGPSRQEIQEDDKKEEHAFGCFTFSEAKGGQEGWTFCKEGKAQLKMKKKKLQFLQILFDR